MSTDDLRAIREHVEAIGHWVRSLATVSRADYALMPNDIESTSSAEAGGECKSAATLLAESSGNASASATATSSLGDALRELADRRPACHVDTDGVAWQGVNEGTFYQLADQADALTAERDRAWDEGYNAADAVTTAVINAYRPIEAERDRLREQVERVRALLDRPLIPSALLLAALDGEGA